MELLGLKTPIVYILTQYGNGLGGSLPLDFLICRFNLVKCPTGYKGDFVGLEEHWTFYRCQDFVIAFFNLVLFPSQLGSINFAVLPPVSTFPHSVGKTGFASHTKPTAEATQGFTSFM